MHVKILRSHTSIDFLHALLPLVLTLFLLISNNQTDALKIAKDYTVDVATVKSPLITLNQGTKGSSTISTTHDFATITTTAGFMFYVNSSASAASGTTFNPTTQALTVGTGLTGSVSYLADIGANYIFFDETGGTPGFDYYFNFTGVSSAASSFNFTVLDNYYEQTPQYHIVYTELYNYSSSSWIIEANYTRETAYTWHMNTTSANGLVQNGIVMGRIYHPTSGTASDDELIDYIGLTVLGTTNSPATTAFSAPTSSSSFTIATGTSIYLYSPIFASATTVYAGSWVLDLWASATSSGTMSVSFVALDSSNNTVASAASGNTATIGTSKSEVKTTFTGAQISVPVGGYLVASITNPAGSGNTFTIYWGSGQTTNYQTPADFDYILTISNSASTAYYLSLSTYSSSSISRLTNLTITVYSPVSNQVIITNGAFTQSSGSAVTLSASSTLYIKVYAAANSFGSSNIVLLMKFSPDSRPFAYDVVNLMVN
jgi:hypothetical protein